MVVWVWRGLNISLDYYLIDEVRKSVEVAQIDKVIGPVDDVKMTIRNILSQVFASVLNNKVLTAPDNVGGKVEVFEEGLKVVDHDFAKDLLLVFIGVAVVTWSRPTQELFKCVVREKGKKWLDNFG